MKKQLFFILLALFTLGISQTFAQVELTPTPISGDCIDLNDPLNVVPGVAYTYSVIVDNPPGNKSFHWLVTQDTQFIQNGGLVATAELDDGSSPILASGDSHYNKLMLNEPSIELTWQSFMLDVDKYVFVVLYVVNEDGCSTDNLKVYRIRPRHAFTLDIANVDFDTDNPANSVAELDNLLEKCISDVQSAVFDPDFGPDGGVTYDFGADTLYFVVAAANFQGSYQLYALFNGLQTAVGTGQEATIYWAYTLAGLETASGQNITNGTSITLAEKIDAQDATGTVGPGGELVFIMVIIEHNTFEAAAGADSYGYTLAVDGLLWNIEGTVLLDEEYADIHHESPCETDEFDNDIATQFLTARPTVIPVSPDEYLPIAP